MADTANIAVKLASIARAALIEAASTLPVTVPSTSDRRQAAQQKVWIVLPAYNEQESLPPLLDAIQAALEPAGIRYGVIVVDDGSRDATGRRRPRSGRPRCPSN